MGDLKKEILSNFPKINSDLLDRYEFRAVSYLKDVFEFELTADGTLTDTGIGHKTTIIISTPTDLRSLKTRPVFDDDDDDDDDENKEKANIYQGLTHTGVLEKLIQGEMKAKEERLLLRYFDIHTEDMVQHEKFVDLPKDVINKVVKRKRLNIEEKNLFSALVKWGKAECKRTDLEDKPNNLRNILEEEIPFIRFPVMSLEDVSSIVIPTQLLSTEETLQLYLYLGSTKEKRDTIKMQFNCKSRKPRLPPNFFGFKWDSTRKHSDLVVAKEGTEASTLPNSGWQSVFGDSLIPEWGIFEWYVTLDKYNTSNSYNVAIGIVPESFVDWTHTTLCGYNIGWTFICGNGKKCCNSPPDEYSSAKFVQGDKVGVRIDMDKHEISFLHNNTDLGIAWKNLPKSVRPCLSLVQQQVTTLHFPES